VFHQPVLLKEAIDYLAIKPGEKYLDATVGGGGHSLAILKSDGQVLSIDCDPEAIAAAGKIFSSWKKQACPSSWQLARGFTLHRLVRGNFAHLKKIARQHHFESVSGVLFDLGVSKHQLTKPSRGFSFQQPGPLDMRMDPSLKVTAADLVNGLSEKELVKLFIKYGDEFRAKVIAKAIIRARRQEPIKTTQQLIGLIQQVKHTKRRIHPATQVFQALRIAVNDELNNLRVSLKQAFALLKPGGRLVVISFHSGEDRIVKQFFKQLADERQAKLLTKKPVRPRLDEIKSNPASRSAKLRALCKLNKSKMRVSPRGCAKHSREVEHKKNEKS